MAVVAEKGREIDVAVAAVVVVAAAAAESEVSKV